jgi:hypothetical protein
MPQYIDIERFMLKLYTDVKLALVFENDSSLFACNKKMMKIDLSDAIRNSVLDTVSAIIKQYEENEQVKEMEKKIVETEYLEPDEILNHDDLITVPRKNCGKMRVGKSKSSTKSCKISKAKKIFRKKKLFKLLRNCDH